MSNVSFQWLKPLPNSWTPGPHGQWPDVAPLATLPASKIYGGFILREGQSAASCFARGMTHHEAGLFTPAGETIPVSKRYSGALRTENVFGSTQADTLSESAIRTAAQQYWGKYGLWVGEANEGNGYVHADNQIWQWFYPELRMGLSIDAKIAHDYGTNWREPAYSFTGKSPSDFQFVYNQPVSEWPYSQAKSLIDKVDINFYEWYRVLADDENAIYQMLFQLEVSRRSGFMPGVFMFHHLESKLGPAHGPGFSYEVDMSNHPTAKGKLYRGDKPLNQVHELLGVPLMALEWGDVFVYWDGTRTHSNDITKVNTYANEFDQPGADKDYWAPNPGQPASFPYTYTGGTRYPTNPEFTYDMMHFGGPGRYAKLAATEGGTPVYATFRINGGSWITPQGNGSDVLAAWGGTRGVCRVRVVGNKVRVTWVDPYAANTSRTLEIKHPTQPTVILGTEVFGRGAQVAEFSIPDIT